MDVNLIDLLNYIKIQEKLEKLYTMYYNLDNYNKFIKRIIRYKIMKKYKKILKQKKCEGKVELNQFILKTKHVLQKLTYCFKNNEIKKNKYTKITKEKISKHDTDIKANEIKHFVTIDKFRKIIKSKFRPFFKKYKGGEFCATDLYCVDCDIIIKNKMLIYHLKGKKHKRYKTREKFYEILCSISYMKQCSKKFKNLFSKKLFPFLSETEI